MDKVLIRAILCNPSLSDNNNLVDLLEMVDAISNEDAGLVGKDSGKGVFEDVVIDVSVDS